ncbi:hypothetical protein TYRP_022116 [Tyrophagus putrescentiae]|nr:hypothetical protein TYRP_022116 [Tyrophagus putrescentiae]
MHLKTFILCLVVQAIFCHDLNQNSLLPSTSDDWLNNNKKQQQNFVAASTRDADRTIFNPFLPQAQTTEDSNDRGQ